MGFWWRAFKAEMKESVKRTFFGIPRKQLPLLIVLLFGIGVSVGVASFCATLAYALLFGVIAFATGLMSTPVYDPIITMVRFFRMLYSSRRHGNYVAYYSNAVVPLDEKPPLSQRGLDNYIKLVESMDESPLIATKDYEINLTPFSSEENYRVLLSLIAGSTRNNAPVNLESVEMALMRLREDNHEIVYSRIDYPVSASFRVFISVPLVMGLALFISAYSNLRVYGCSERSNCFVAVKYKCASESERCVRYIDSLGYPVEDNPDHPVVVDEEEGKAACKDVARGVEIPAKLRACRSYLTRGRGKQDQGRLRKNIKD